MDVFLDVYGANPGSTLSLTRNASPGLGRPRRGVAGASLADGTALQRRFPETPTYPIAVRPNRADDLAASRRT